LWFLIEYRQKDWPEQLAKVESMMNNKVYSITKVSSFLANYNRELRIEVDIRKNEKSLRESWSNIEKSTKRDKQINR